MEDEINDQQRLFVDAYCGVARCNATKAAKLAGYACPTEAGYRLRKMPAVRAAIEACLDESAASRGEILAALSELGLCRTVRVKDSDKIAALSLLARCRGMLTDRVEHTGEIRFRDLAGMTDEELKDIAEGRA